ncbi:WAT1-related protein [Sesamum angolense]|uniref:WAT1-related protein n=1 Tax=Sesamum angolense TaxID=2727404 RepID=A0AAE1WA39_9LAMI|nr:WAT1-related protein [Sesamum angolense]
MNENSADKNICSSVMEGEEGLLRGGPSHQVTLFQSLVMKGVSLTSPAMATAMPILRQDSYFACPGPSEKIELACRYSRAKIVGTLLCVFGAVVLSLMQSTFRDNEFDAEFPSTSPPHVFFDKQTMLGCVYLIASVVVFSSQVVLQAITLRDFPAPMSLCALTSVIGVLITVAVEMVEDEGWDPGSLTIQEMIAYSTLAGSVSGMCVSFNSWAMKKRGPVVVSIFNPLATVISAIFSLLTFGESISVGREEGLLMSNDDDDDLQTKYDMEKPFCLDVVRTN